MQTAERRGRVRLENVAPRRRDDGLHGALRRGSCSSARAACASVFASVRASARLGHLSARRCEHSRPEGALRFAEGVRGDQEAPCGQSAAIQRRIRGKNHM